MTKERIQQFRDGFAAMTGNERDEVCALAIAHLDSARARRVGEAVIAALAEWGEREIDYANAWDGLPASQYEMMRAVEAALRGEP